MMNTHKAFKRLQRAGINDRQAEVMVDIFAQIQQDNALSRADVMQAFTRHNQHILRLSKQSENMETDLSVLRTDFGSLKSDVSVLRTDFGSLKSDVSILRTDVDSLKSDVSVLRTDVDSLKSDVSVLRTDVNSLKTDVNRLTMDVSTLRTDVDEIRTDVGGLKNDMCWVKRLLMVMTTTLLMAAMKYMLV
ncbi:coiled-coil domain-containing protein [Pantoea stewartii]|uniref:coiled-coil domain-containing protein n=1 Tax=Pantoea stewartii TaxID=66269 RepID=UPI001CF785AF|nr:coiled-coil domain-containing protein [Pantoea stewartii]